MQSAIVQLRNAIPDAKIKTFASVVTLSSLKERVIEIGYSLGFNRVVIASLAPLDEEALTYQKWLDSGFAAGMEYLKREPARRSTPALIYPGSLCAIVASVSYFSEPPPEPDFVFGRVARYAVGLDYHPVIRAKMREYAELIAKECGRELVRRPFVDDVALYEQALAARHGLGFVGKHSLIIGPKLMGTYNFVAELFVDLELEADEAYSGTCGSCFRCGIACPTDAITSGALVDSNLCISYLTIENKGAIERSLRPKLSRWVFGCDICQEVCPYNRKAAPAPWPEFASARGSGHYLDLLELLNIDDAGFAARFATSPLRRPKRRGLLRNALVVLGNVLGEEGRFSGSIVEALSRFISCEEDPMLIEHAAWAIACNRQALWSPRVKDSLYALSKGKYRLEPDGELALLIDQYARTTV